MADLAPQYLAGSSNFVSGTGNQTHEVLSDLLNERVVMYTHLNNIRKRYRGPTAPTNPNTGDTWQDSTTDKRYWYNGSIWVEDITSAIGVTTRNVVIQGPVDSSGNPTLFAAGTGLNCNLSATATNVILTFANGNNTTLGETDIIGSITADVSSFFANLPINSTVYPYINRNTSTGAITGGYSTIAPVYQRYAPSHAAGKHWFDTVKQIMYISDGVAWTAVQRMFVGTATTDASSVTAVNVYPYNVLRQDIINVPAGNMVSTNIQSAINELDGRVGVGRGAKNLIINGDILVDQRNAGAVQTFIAAAAIAYCVDRFYASCTGANITGQRVAGTGLYLYDYLFTGAAGNTGVLFGQRIESLNCRDLISKTVTCQAQISSSALTSVTWTAYYANVADNFSTKTQIATGTITINSIQTIYNFSFNAGANAGNGICIEFTTGALLATQTLRFSGIQLEKGSVATPFEVLEIGDVLRKCQRYREDGTFFIQSYSPGANNYIGASYSYKVSKRTIPTLIFTDTGSSALVTPTTVSNNINGFVRNATTTGTGSSVISETFIANAEL